MREQEFDVVLVDEASQLTEPDTLAAINRGERFVLVGDHEQLPPVVRSGGRLSESLFQRLVETNPEAAVMLDQQYRMSQRIQAFSSDEFYDGQLRPATAEVAGQTLADLGIETGGAVRNGVPASDASGGSSRKHSVRDGVSFHDVEGTDDAHVDPVEAERVGDIVREYVDAGLDPADVGVIAPFRAQVAEIGRHVPDGVSVDTVDRFQGSSKEVIVVSFVATGTLDGPIFEDHRRVNVALTRAKKSLVLVGDETALRSEPSTTGWSTGRRWTDSVRDDEFADRLPVLHRGERLTSRFERVGLSDFGFEPSGRDQVDERLQVGLGAHRAADNSLVSQVEVRHVDSGLLARGATADDHPSTSPQDVQADLRVLAAEVVHDGVRRPYRRNVSTNLVGVGPVDGVVEAEFGRPVEFLARRGRPHGVGAEHVRELHGSDADAAGDAGDEHEVVRFHLCPAEHVVGGHVRRRHRRGRRGVHGVGERDESVGVYAGGFREAAVVERVVLAEVLRGPRGRTDRRHTSRSGRARRGRRVRPRSRPRPPR